MSKTKKEGIKKIDSKETATKKLSTATAAETEEVLSDKIAIKPKTEKKTSKPKKEDLGDIDDSLLIEGITYIEKNKLEAAIECFEEFTKKYPNNHFGWYYIGYTKMLQNKTKDAMKNFIKAKKLDEKFIPSIYYQGLLEFENNTFDKALIIFDEIMDKFTTDEIKESNFNIPYFIAICHHYLGNLQRAEEYFLFAYNISPDDPVVLYYKGFNELSLRNYDFAMETFKNLLMVDMNNQMFWDLVKGYSYFYHQHNDIEEK